MTSASLLILRILSVGWERAMMSGQELPEAQRSVALSRSISLLQGLIPSSAGAVLSFLQGSRSRFWVEHWNCRHAFTGGGEGNLRIKV